jgi:hypothetical protein
MDRRAFLAAWAAMPLYAASPLVPLSVEEARIVDALCSQIVRVLPVELRSRCLRQWFKEIVLSDVARGDTRGHENGYPGGAGP